jgi:hypothetical protein
VPDEGVVTGSNPSECHDLGVLLVPGIGERRQGTTLLRWGGALQRWLDQWLWRATVPSVERGIVVQQSERRPSPSDVPAHATLALAADAGKRLWLFAEAWWISEVSPLRFREVVRWVVPLLPSLASEYSVAATPKVDPEDPPPTLGSRGSRWVERASFSGLIWLFAPILPILLGALIIVSAVFLIALPPAALLAGLGVVLLERLPIVGQWIDSLTSRLARGVTGDYHLFSHDAFARAAMIDHIRRDVEWLRTRGCKRVVIVAYSQGAILCHDMLNSAPPKAPVDLLITVGSGIHRVDSLRRLYRTGRLHHAGAGFGALAMLSIGMLLVVGQLGSPALGLWAWSGFALIVLGALLPGMHSPAIQADLAGAHQPSSTLMLMRSLFMGVGAAVLLAVGLVTGGWDGARLVLGATLINLGVTGYSRNDRMVAERSLARPYWLALPRTAVKRWIDYYATADPVPNGSLRTWTEDVRPKEGEAVHPEPRCVHNLRSIRADHFQYLGNMDEFVPQLALDLAGDGLNLGPLKSREDLLRQRAERRWRTYARTDARNLLLFAGLLALVTVTLGIGGGKGLSGIAADLGVSSAPPYGPLDRLLQSALDWLAQLPLVGQFFGNIASVAFAGVVAATAALCFAMVTVSWLWSLWNQRSIDQSLRRHLGSPQTTRARASMIRFFVLVGMLVAGCGIVAQRYAGVWWPWFAILAAAIFTAVVMIQRWRTILGPA